MIYQLDKTTEIIYEYIEHHPKSEREMICCLDSHSNDDLRTINYSYGDAFQDYAYTCLDYLLELGLIFEVNKEGHKYYSVSAKGNAYKRYKILNFVKEYAPHIISILSLAAAIVLAIKG